MILAASSALRLAAVERDHGVDLGRVDRDLVGEPAAPAEADHADLAGGAVVGLEERDRGDRIGDVVLGIDPGDDPARLVLVRGRAADRRQEIRGERDEALERRAPRHVLDMGIEAAVLVDHDDARQLAAGVRRAREIGLHLAARARDR